MQGLDIADFNAKNNSLFSDYDSTLIDLQERLEKLESACFNNKNVLVERRKQSKWKRKNLKRKLLKL